MTDARDTREEAEKRLVDYLACIRLEFADDIEDLEAEARARLIGEGYPAEQAAFIAAAPRLIRSLLDQLQEQEKATRLIADILQERADELTKEACDVCEDCGALAMCRFHSVLSALAGHTWTNGAIERDNLKRRVQEQAQEIARLKADAAFLVQDYHAEKLSLMERADAAEASLSAQAQRIEQVRDEMQKALNPRRTQQAVHFNQLAEWIHRLSALSGEPVRIEQTKED